MYGTAKNAAIYWALGIPEHTHGTANALSLINLGLLTGQIGRHGTGLNPLRGQNNVQGASDSGAMPWHYPGYQRWMTKPMPSKFEKGWHIEPGGLNRKRGLTTTEIVDAIGPNGSEITLHHGRKPDDERAKQQSCPPKDGRLEFFAAQDLFINESRAYADVFLPAATWAEKDGTFTNTDRRVQRIRQALPNRWKYPTGLGDHLRPGFRDLKNGLGVKDSSGWVYSHPSEVIEEMGKLGS